MSSHVRVASGLRDRLEQKFLEQKRERDDLCRYLAGWCGVAIFPGDDPHDVFDDCREAAEVCQDAEKMKTVDRINNYTLDMRTIEELLRSA